MARTCSDGKVYTCSCDQYLEQPTDPDADWKWGGCSDNYKFGYKFSKRFTDSIEKGEDLRYMVNKQNNEAGRRVSEIKSSSNICCTAVNLRHHLLGAKGLLETFHNIYIPCCNFVQS